MLVYILIFFIMTITALSIPDRQARPFLIAFLIFLWWFMGLRYWVGCDFPGYLNRWNNLYYTGDYQDLIGTDEFLFTLLMLSLRDSGFSYIWLNVCAAGIFLMCTYFYARGFRDSLMLLALLFPVVIVQLEMSGIRQGLATGFLMVAIVALKNGSKIWTAAFIMIGAQFHSSAYMMLPLALLAGTKISTLRLVLSVAVIAPLAGMLLASRAEVYESRYIGTDVSSGGALIRYVLIFIPSALFALNYKKIKQVFPNDVNILKLFAILGFSIFPLVFLSTVALHRVNYYIMPFTNIVAVYVSYVVMRPIGGMSGRSLPAVMFGAYGIAWFLTSYHAGCFYPYQNVTFVIGLLNLGP